jgi:hypothetical protein
MESFLRGGPPLRLERLLRLALIADLDPSDVFRAGARAALADSRAAPWWGCRRLGDTQRQSRGSNDARDVGKIERETCRI